MTPDDLVDLNEQAAVTKQVARHLRCRDDEVVDKVGSLVDTVSDLRSQVSELTTRLEKA